MTYRRKQKFHGGRWAVQKERLHIEDDTPPSAVRATPSIKEIIPGCIEKWGMQDQLYMREISDAWKSIVGPQVATHTRPGRIHNNVLVIYVRHSIWLSELQRYGQKTILEKLKKRPGANKIKSIRLQLDPDYQ